MGQSISLNTRHGRISGWIARPHIAPRGALVLVHEVFGLTPHMRQTADRFANYGYVTLAPALFDRVHPGTVLEYDEAGLARGRQIVEELGFNGALDGVRGAYDYLEADHRVAVVGYCWGGTVAYLANARMGIPAVSYYGARTVPFLGERPKAPLLLHFGAEDPLIPPDDVEKHREALSGAEIHVWPGAGHGFSCSARPDFHAESDRLAMERTLMFLQKVLR
ncbi:dienelactone hydrolase family protein [Arenimonas fontis]|uniref:Dienelactone hydrolase family protein n=1 Tax=Arenimonas fontis TaxID=2608255 RepID=A0A5B2ZEC6_9GAMM|nr:dienelactone hydrolase family protein [Arenimonas fontis]KAA2285550.1 dienelactone hydrolase family protein [Arenimonas fontis]